MRASASASASANASARIERGRLCKEAGPGPQFMLLELCWPPPGLVDGFEARQATTILLLQPTPPRPTSLIEYALL